MGRLSFIFAFLTVIHICAADMGLVGGVFAPLLAGFDPHSLLVADYTPRPDLPNAVNGWFSAVDGLLGRFPEWKNPASQFLGESTASLGATIKTQWFDSFAAVIDKNPEWGQPTSKLLGDKLGTFGSSSWSSAANSFTNYLDTNPDLKGSTSDFTAKFLAQKEVELKELAAFLNRSPLADNIRYAQKMSAGEIADYLGTGFAEKSAPLRASLADYGGKVFDLYFGGLSKSVSVPSVSVPSVGGISLPSAPQGDAREAVAQRAEEINALLAGAGGAVNSASKVALDTVTPVLDGLSSSATGVVDGAATAVPRAFVTLGDELSRAGDKLNSNVGTGLTATVDSISSVVEGASKALARPANLPAAPAGIPADGSFVSYYKSTNPVPKAGVTLPSLDPLFTTVGQWKLFSDPDHMTNGYWEQQWAKLQNFDKTSADAANVVSEKAQLLGGKWNNYVNDVLTRTDGAVSKSLELSDTFAKNWAERWGASEAKYNANMEKLEPIVKDIQENGVPALQRTIGDISTTVISVTGKK